MYRNIIGFLFVKRLAILTFPALLFTCSIFAEPINCCSNRNPRQQDDEISRLKAQIQSLKASEKTTTQRIETLRLEKTLHLKEAERTARRIPEIEAGKEKLEKEEAALFEIVKKKRQKLAPVLRRLYINGRLSKRLLRLLMTVEDQDEVTLAYNYLKALVQREKDFIDGYVSDILALQEKQKEITESLAHLKQLQREEREASEKAELAEQEHNRLLLQIRARLDALMERLTKIESDVADMGFADRKGQLLWPCRGEVVAKYGRNHDDTYNVVIECDGIEIKAKTGTPVSAIHRGKVVFRDWLDERGNMVVLDHGKGYYTLYAHLKDFSVRMGDEVPAGQQIGAVGQTGSIKGSILHFEIRRFAKPQNPENWLRKR